jgi:phosphate transport system substrate-binding protein
VKKAHVGVIPGIPEYLAEYTSDRASGEEGYLADKGLIPAPEAERAATAADVQALKVLSADAL